MMTGDIFFYIFGGGFGLPAITAGSYDVLVLHFCNLSVRKDLHEVMRTQNVIRSPPRFPNALRRQEAEANVRADTQEDFRCT